MGRTTPGTRVAAVLVAAGRGERFGPTLKQAADIGGRTLVERSAAALLDHPGIDAVVCVVPADAAAAAIVGAALGAAARHEKMLAPVAGGARRQDSVLAGVRALPAGFGVVAIHDAARPFPPPESVERAIDAVTHGGADGAILGVPVTDTLKQVGAGERIVATADRASFRAAQTPQVFRRDVLERALAASAASDITDDAQAVERTGGRVVVVEGAPTNLKVTTLCDLATAEAIARSGASTAAPAEFSVGIGYDVHRLVEGRPLILGGVRLESPVGLDGHSDADVLAHAIIDAILGAAGQGDIGQHFPPSDERWRGADSIDLMRRAWEGVHGEGWRIVHVDAVVAAERPRLAPHLAAMRARVGPALDATPSRVHIKATTNERLGFVGRAEGIAAWAVAMLERPRPAHRG